MADATYFNWRRSSFLEFRNEKRVRPEVRPARRRFHAGGEPDRPGSTVGAGAAARSIEALGPQADDARERRLGRIAGDEHFAASVLGCSETL